MLNSDDLTAIYEGLCAHISESPIPWPGIGHMWTSPIIRHFCRTAPRRLDAWLEVPAGDRKTLDLAWAAACPATTSDRLELALESEQQYWMKPLAEWLGEIKTDLSKVLRANTPAGILICARERPAEHDYVNIAFGAIQGVLPAPLDKLLLVVVLTPPGNGQASGCTTHGIIHGPDGLHIQLRTVNCWRV